MDDFTCDTCGLSIFECKCPPPVEKCPKCKTGNMLWQGEYAGYPGETLSVFECDECKHQEIENDFPSSECPNCGAERKLIDADESGPKYSQCTKCTDFDVWNPAPNVFMVR